jgi:uncharacterized protein UPF0547
MGLGMGEIIVILVFMGAVAVIAFICWLASRRFNFLGYHIHIQKELKTCPYCAEYIKMAAKICRYCQRDVASVEIENKPPRGLFQ